MSNCLWYVLISYLDSMGCIISYTKYKHRRDEDDSAEVNQGCEGTQREDIRRDLGVKNITSKARQVCCTVLGTFRGWM